MKDHMSYGFNASSKFVSNIIEGSDTLSDIKSATKSSYDAGNSFVNENERCI